MRTDDLIAVLAADAAPVDVAGADRRFLLKLAAGVALAFVLMFLLLGPRPDLPAAASLPMFWVKLGLPAAVGAGTWLLLLRLAHPGMRAGRAPLAAVLPLGLMILAGVLVLANAPAGDRLPLLLGDTWRDCLVNIPLLSVPAFVLAFSALRGLAPTRPTLAGAAAGLSAGAAAAFAYAIHCPELAAPFLGAWYVIGMLVPTALGALLGRRWLRW
jgi:hypothetical protein